MATLEFFEGPMRNGKSLLANKAALECVRDGGVIGVNYEMVENWAYIYAGRTMPFHSPDEKILERAIDYWERSYRIGTVQSLYELSEILPQKVKGRRAKRRESKGVLVLDECGLYFNAREWSSHMEFIQFITAAGKLQWEVKMISHSSDDIDKQIRCKIERITSVRNLKRRKLGGIDLGMFFRKPKFRTLSRIGGSGAGSGTIEEKGLFGLDYNTCDLYDTFFLFDREGNNCGLEKLGEHPEKIYKRMNKDRLYERFSLLSPSSPWPRQCFYEK